MAESVRDIKRRIKSVKNIAQITKAMEAVSANKMRKSQMVALSARPYAVTALEMLDNLISRTPVLPDFFAERPIKKSLILVVTSDKGLAGAYNSNVLRSAEKLADKMKKAGQSFAVVTVGRKAKEYFSRRGAEVVKSFSGFSDLSALKETNPVADFVTAWFMRKSYDEAFAVYTNFKTTLRQEVSVRRILPVTKDGIAEMVLGILPEHGRYAPKAQGSIEKAIQSRYSFQYVFEPDPANILNALVPKLLSMHIHHIILEANASEHSSRMVAMKNASDNAKDLIAGLSLKYNKLRQAGITRELIEITAGREALNN
ncbi:MAG: ATP synthase F1 subunit gamma [Candidatus Colwellbacteria bacterium RIFCSPLOWO2_01_FULL_48_10]|uniref:ATP synthase gamma chain n=2 Tax=Bacteria candidate phyla TaxID=1783234 RepID=A0A1F5P0G5_9BACT|nr:MAG: ATP synthase F1 subunit gamma [Candidatus Doudnabacteria bacterium RIFCSPHIGHO2_01_FULL_49_9]OGY60364.1 MAG: ATP synthase F1 subunit gamma [Candidatus Colwellbacteria bacterium RIFCSPLOWO2_01_FULL_48_10]